MKFFFRRPTRLVLGALLVGCMQAGGEASAASGLPSTGSLTGGDGLTVTGSAEVLYDSNQLRSRPTALNPNPHSDDFRYSPALSAVYNRNSGRLSLTANAVVGRDFFQYNSYLDRNRYIGGGTLTYHSGASCQASLNGTYASRQSGVRGANNLVEDPTAAPDDVGIVIDNIQRSSAYGVNANCGSPGGRLSFGGGYSHSSLSNASALRRFGDSDSDSFNGNVGIGILRPGQLSINGSYSTIAYPNRLGQFASGVAIPPQLLNTGVHTYRIGVSFSRPIGTRLSGSLGVSFLHTDPTGGQSPYNAPAYTLGLTYTASPRLNFVLNGSRDVLASTAAGALYRVVDQAQFAAHYSLGSAITIDANAGLIRNDYKQPFAIPGEVARRNETTKVAGLGMTFAPRSLYDLSLFVSHTLRSSDPSTFNYNSTKVSATLAVHI